MPRRRSSLHALADEELMALVRHGEARAFEVVVGRHERAAFSLAYRIVGSRNGAEDVAQEAFLSLWRAGARYDAARGSVRTWILGIVHNRAIDALRRGATHERRWTTDDGIAERLEAPDRTDEQVGRRDEAREIRGALAQLPPDQLRVVELAYFGGYTHSEIADMLGAPLGTVKGRMRLGLAKLREHLEAVGATA